MMFLRQLLLALVGMSAGLIVSAGVFTVLISVGLIPRFAGKMHVAHKVFVLEEAVILGTLRAAFSAFTANGGRWGPMCVCMIFSDRRQKAYGT